MTLALRPAGRGAEREVALTREKIDFNPVTSQLCSGGQASTSGSSSESGSSGSGGGAEGRKVGYIRVATFSKQTPEAARAAVQRLKADGADRCASSACQDGWTAS